MYRLLRYKLLIFIVLLSKNNAPNTPAYAGFLLSLETA